MTGARRRARNRSTIDRLDGFVARESGLVEIRDRIYIGLGRAGFEEGGTGVAFSRLIFSADALDL